MEKIEVSHNQAASVDAYLEYRRIVGDDDNGRLFTPEEYEQYKKDVIPSRMKNRLYVSWTSPTGMDCKMVGPETPCFCTHRFKQHKTDFKNLPETRPIHLPCKAARCKCSGYSYVPMNGSQAIRCTCKHPSDEHSPCTPYPCDKVGCTKCVGFKSSFTCGCGQATSTHSTIVETRDEREARGHPVGQDTPYKAMGGLTGFSSLADGYQRLDPSGVGAPSAEVLAQPVSASDHPFLRANVAAVNARREALGQTDTAEYESDLAEQMAAMKQPGEDDMTFYERRYQERLKAEREAKRSAVRSNAAATTKPTTGKRRPLPPT